MSKPEEFKFDSRVRDRFLRSRVLSQTEVEKHLQDLPDLEGQYEVMNDMPQPAVAPPRSEIAEEPLVFDGIRRLQALGEASSPAPAPRYVPPAPPSSGGLPAYREEARPLGTPLRSALMESEISGVGAGAVSAALGAMAAEARGASVFGVPASIPQPSIPQPSIPQPPIPQPAVAQPSFTQPAVAQPSFTQPSIVQPSFAQPSIVQPAQPSEEAPTPVTLRSDAAPSPAEAAAPSEPAEPESAEPESVSPEASDEDDEEEA